MVRVVDEVCDGQVDIEVPDIFPKITSCYYCGGLLFYQVISKVENTEHATDTEIYCAICGRHNGGMFSDPFDEMELLKDSGKTIKHPAEKIEDEEASKG